MNDAIDSFWKTFGGILSPHGPASVGAAATYAPGDYSIHFFLQLAVILFACRIVSWAGQRFLGQPPVVGEMIAGVVLGPSLLGLFLPEWQSAIFPKETRNVLYAGAQLGVALYMFLVGLTLRLAQRDGGVGVRRHRTIPDRGGHHAAAVAGARPVHRRDQPGQCHAVHGRVHRADRLSDARPDHQ
jgi:hypothetical protein